ncbi:MAG: hypothetical protein CMM93_04635 [Rickettsiales bacterium]|nr:hypothetical protein [Rickettsiales bacterium]|tara:strand:+ start:488 stop:802 length:315 start_codon:yes stop_codon:yes gene_type:complete
MTVNVNYPLPTVHWNGTPQETLLKDAEKLSNAVDQAYNIVLQAMSDCEVGVHGRDYYVQDPSRMAAGDALKQAQDERGKHIQNLIAFRQYALEHVMHLQHSNDQ